MSIQEHSQTRIPAAIASIVCAALLIPSFGQAQSAQAEGKFQELTLRLATTAKAPLPLEPIPIAITLANETAKPIVAKTTPTPNAGLLDIYIIDLRVVNVRVHSFSSAA